MTKTRIAWATEVWNPTVGCTKISPGCKNCYAKTLFERFHPDPKFETVRLIPDRLGDPLRWKNPRAVFVDSMSDLFHPDVPTTYIAQVFAAMTAAPQHIFMVLTKRPGRMCQLMNGVCELADGMKRGLIPPVAFFNPSVEWPIPNVWLGVSVEDPPTARERIPLLLQTPAAKRFVSLEPLLTGVDLTRWLPQLDWAIIGGESGPRYRPLCLMALQYTVKMCRDYGVPVFVKQDSGLRPGKQGRIPDDLWIQEVPDGYPAPAPVS